MIQLGVRKAEVDCKPLPSIETLISRNAKEELIGNIPGIFKTGLNRRIDSSYKLIEVLSGTRGSADTVVNVGTVGFRFGALGHYGIRVYAVNSHLADTSLLRTAAKYPAKVIDV